MINFYEDITAFYGFYDLMGEIIPNNGKWLEVGAWLGNSIVYAANITQNLNKQIQFTVVDKWERYPELAHFWTKNGWDDDGAYNQFLENIKNFNNITHVRKTSWEAAKQFPDNYFDFIFIDGAHDYDTVAKDIRAYYPKVKTGGMIAGDDFGTKKFTGLTEAVNEWHNELFKKNVSNVGRCWFKKING